MKKIVMKNYIILLGTLLLLSGCYKKDEFYKEFIEKGEQVYVGKVDSVVVMPGNNRAMLSWKLSPDPSVSKIRVYWGNSKDSLDIDVTKAQIGTRMEVLIPVLAEGSYSFKMLSLSNAGNKSVVVEGTGNVYGAQYIGTLANRSISKVTSASGGVTITWLPNSSEQAVFTEVSYMDKNDVAKVVKMDKGVDQIILTDAKSGTNLQYRVAYFPEPLSIDTFYTETNSVLIP